jgi:hypothetical protein
MKKIPTLFERSEDRRYVTNVLTPGCEWVMGGEGVATQKYDGTCVLIRRDGMDVEAFTRREVKPGKQAPDNWTEADSDVVTGKRVGWEPAAQSGFAKFVLEALEANPAIAPGTYELIGPKINGNPEDVEMHHLASHSDAIRYPDMNCPQSYDELRSALMSLSWEGIVWHHPDGRMVKLKRRDFNTTAVNTTEENTEA